jgi:SRSO17 transposase
MDRIAQRFTRCELAELSGLASPDRLQHLLSRVVWDADAVRDDMRSYVVDHLGDDDAVLVVDLCHPRNYAEAQVGDPKGYAVVGLS